MKGKEINFFVVLPQKECYMIVDFVHFQNFVVVLLGEHHRHDTNLDLVVCFVH